MTGLRFKDRVMTIGILLPMRIGSFVEEGVEASRILHLRTIEVRRVSPDSAVIAVGTNVPVTDVRIDLYLSWIELSKVILKIIFIIIVNIALDISLSNSNERYVNHVYTCRYRPRQSMPNIYLFFPLL